LLARDPDDLVSIEVTTGEEDGHRRGSSLR
jgi:hypothetical protein